MTAGSAYNSRCKEYSHVSEMKQYEKDHSATMLGNSSGGYLSEDYNVGGEIYKAYLVVESSSDGSYNVNDKAFTNENGMFNYPVTIVGKKTVEEISVDHYTYIYKNIRRSGYIDITDFVKENGYGWYYVCNIPYDKENQISSQDAFASWRIIVIEQNEKIPMRLLSLELGCNKADNQGQIMTISGDGITTKSQGNVTGQLLFSFCGSDPRGTTANKCNWVQYECSSSLLPDEDKFDDIITTSGIRSEKNPLVFIFSRNGIPLSSNGFTKSEYINQPYFIPSTIKYTTKLPSGIEYYTADASDVELIDVDGSNEYSNIVFGNNIQSVSLSYKVDGASLISDILGISVDIDVPTFDNSDNSNGNYQKTELVNTEDGTVGAKITGVITNTSQDNNVGISKSELIFGIDEGLSIDKYNVILHKDKSDDAGTQLTGGISANNTIVFTDIDISTTGAYITYTISGTKNTIARTEIINYAKISGYYTNNGIVTNTYIDGVAYCLSKEKPAYKLTINLNGGKLNGVTDNVSCIMTSGDIKSIIPERTGYVLASWNVKGTYSSINNNIFTMGGENTILIAQWTYNPVSVKVPQVLVSDKNGNSSFRVKCDDIKSGSIKVGVAASFIYKQTGKADIVAVITQKSNSNIITSSNKSVVYDISTSGLSAGSWQGSFNIDLTLTKE